MRLDQLLMDRRDAIVRRFVSELQRQEVGPAGTSRTNLVDHIPIFVDELLAQLQGRPAIRDSQDVSDVSPTARRHGVQRSELGFDLGALVREYGVLRHCILTEAKEADVTLSIDELDKLAMCLNVGVAEAVTAYSEHRDREVVAERAAVGLLAEAGQLLGSSLDSQMIVTRLMRLVLPRLADWCVVHLVDRTLAPVLPAAHVDESKLALLRDVWSHLPSPGGQTRFDTAPANSPEHAVLHEKLGSCSLIIVPLRTERAAFGTVVLAYSDSHRTHQASDVVLAEDLARRAAVAIDNAQLYELSNRERARVEAATRAKDEFVAMISHELRTPLNAILGWARLMRSGTLPSEQHAHAIQIIERNADAQNQLIGDLLDVSRIINGSVRINPAQMDLNDVTWMAIEGVRPAADAKRVTIEAQLDGDGGILRGDADRLQQVIWNLLTNAVKFTPKGGSVKVTLERIDSDLQLVVEDTGIGIAPEFLPHMFDSFRQSDSSATRAHGGLGVGLAIAKHLVTLHGGTLEGRSDGVGHGATFVMRLPIGPLVSSTLGVKRAPAMRAPRDATLPEGLRGLRVLVIDDEEDARELLEVVLEGCGMEVQTATSADEALAMLADHRPDVIVSDIGMPGGDGYELIRRIRALDAEDKKRIPAIALTAYASREERDRALLAGFNAHMAKPADPSALVTLLADLAGRRATEPTSPE